MRCSEAAQSRRPSSAAAVTLPINVLRSMIPPSKKSTLPVSHSFGQQLFSHISQNVKRPLHAHFSRQNRVFVLHAKNALVTHFHVRTDHVFPKGRAVSVADGAEGIRRVLQVFLLENKIQ